MGNTDSHYSNFIIPGKGKSSSLKLHTSKEEALSPHSWWRSSQSTSGYKAKNVFSPHKNSQPYISRHYDCIKGGSSDKVHSESHRDYDNLLFQGNGFFVGYRQQTGGLQAPMRSTSSELKDNKSSPKVLFREDGSLRVEFTNARREPDVELSLGSCLSGPVDAIQRASNGSSLSSEGSWYDSPWGNGTEDLCDNVFTTGQPSDNSSGYTTLSSTRTVDFACLMVTIQSNLRTIWVTSPANPQFTAVSMQAVIAIVMGTMLTVLRRTVALEILCYFIWNRMDYLTFTQTPTWLCHSLPWASLRRINSRTLLTSKPHWPLPWMGTPRMRVRKPRITPHKPCHAEKQFPMGTQGRTRSRVASAASAIGQEVWAGRSEGCRWEFFFFGVLGISVNLSA